MAVEIGIVGAGDRGQKHAEAYESIAGANVVAVADINEEAATALASTYDVPGVFNDYRNMLADAHVDAVSICVHNNLHRPIAVEAADAGCHIFCEKPIAATYVDAKAMADAAEKAGVHLGVQNRELFTPETRAARRLIEDGRLGELYYARGVFSRRRGRPYVDGYGTQSFVSADSAGGGSVIDIGTYVIGQLLYLLGNSEVERVGGKTFEHTQDAYDRSLVGEDSSIYRERLDKSDYDVEDAGIGYAHLADGSVLELRTAWHMFLPDEPNVVAGSKGGIRIDPFEFYTTMADYEASVSLDLEEYERRQALLASDTGYDPESDGGQYKHWIDTLRGQIDDPIPTGDIALNSTLIMDGIYCSEEASRELTAEEIANQSESKAIEP